MECLLDGNYWTTFKDRKSRLRDRAEPPPPPPPSVQGRERQTPPTLIVEEEENDSNNKARAKKKVDKPQEDEVESLLDGRYWQTTSNSRRALREKKRAREAQLDSQGEKRAKFDDVEVLIDLVQDEEEEENEDDGEEEKDEEKDEEIESDVEEPSFAPPSVRNLEPLRDLLLEEPVSFWPAMFRDESVSDATCWSRFMALHSEFDLPPDWTSFSMLIKVKRLFFVCGVSGTLILILFAGEGSWLQCVGIAIAGVAFGEKMERGHVLDDSTLETQV
jgi:hypothetical protein